MARVPRSPTWRRGGLRGRSGWLAGRRRGGRPPTYAVQQVVGTQQIVFGHSYHVGHTASACRWLGQRSHMDEKHGHPAHVDARRPFLLSAVGWQVEDLRREVEDHQVRRRLAVVVGVVGDLLHALGEI